MENSLEILSVSLDKKLAVLERIQEYNKVQEQAFSGTPNMESFDEALAKKDELITELEKLDDGFEALYARITKELQENKEKYAEQIHKLQDKIGQITEMSTTIQAQESRNKALIEKYFTGERAKLKSGRVGSKAAYDYYRNMSGVNLNTSRFMDQKN